MSATETPDPSSNNDTSDDSSSISSQASVTSADKESSTPRSDARRPAQPLQDGRPTPELSSPAVESRLRLSTAEPVPRRPRMPGAADSKGSDDTGDLTLNAAQAMAESTGNDAMLKKLRDAVNAKIAANQQRARMASTMHRSSTGGIRRISSLKQEEVAMVREQANSPVLSPSLAAAFDSPLLTASTESTESVATIKGSAVPTPAAAAAVRTPSYPFPHIPGTPRMLSSSFHKPFTTLSPTVSFHREGENIGSGLSTPVASESMFMPAAFGTSADYRSQYPTPNLYDLVLALNMDPGIDAWWTTVTKVFCEFYSAERMSLALPADAGELENVPWGQKASFSVNGRPKSAHRESKQKHSDSSASLQSQKSIKSALRNVALAKAEAGLSLRSLDSGASRPALNSRHSYAGFEHPSTPAQTMPPLATSNNTLPSRPRLPLRTKSHAPNLLPQTLSIIESNDGNDNGSPMGSNSDSAFPTSSDLDFSTVTSSTHDVPYSQVLTILRALNHETEALLEASSVNRIIDRGKLVVLTRDYAENDGDRKSAQQGVRFEEASSDDHEESRKVPATGNKGIGVSRTGSKSKKTTSAMQQALYEDHEQVPTSPWSQSPAPSPAIQTDEERNPFDSMLDEDSFAPPDTNVDYTRSESVEAIGVDKASTVVHIPLIHPRTAPTHMLKTPSGKPPGAMNSALGQADEGRSSPYKRAPIAILSFSAPVVPFPPNLTQSLHLLAPHLATTFDVAQHYTTAISQKDLLQQRRQIQNNSGRHNVLSGLVDADLDATNDTTLTSPSDYSGYSGRSRQSPGGSVGINTPNWDHSSTGFSHHIPTTPGQDLVDSYFDSRKRTQSSTAQLAKARGTESPGLENDLPAKEQMRRAGDGRPRQLFHKAAADSRNQKSHSLLHSYGADFASTMPSLPSTAMDQAQSATRSSEMSRGSDSGHDMPPPSERLLRTIVDSLPVQIFTAAPQSGTLTWVNSKFIVYRGQGTDQILENPWLAIHSDDRPDYMEEWQRSLTTGQPFSHKVRLKRFDNAYRWFYVRATPLKDKKQKIVHWAGTFMDIHEQHVAEVHAAKQHETAASEAKYRTLANSSPQIVFVMSKTRGLTFCNSQWTLYSGQSEVEASGVGFMDAVHPDDLAKCRVPNLNPDGTPQMDVPVTAPSDGLSTTGTSFSKGDSDESSESSKTVTSGGTDPTESATQADLSHLTTAGVLKVSRDRDGRPSYSTEVRLRAVDGHYRWHLVRVLLSEALQTDEGEDEETWYGTCTDIDDHKTLEQQLKDAMDAKSRFLSNMSHEIRTPLNGITGMVNFLLDSNLTAEQMEHVNIIRNSTEGLRDLINDILDLSKVEAGMIKLTMDWMQVRSLIEEVNDIMFALAMDKGLELNYVVEDNVPNMLKADRFRMRQVLLNVVGNAIKFTSKGEVFVRCKALDSRSGLSNNELLLQFEVVDTGTGFTEKEAESLFKRFSQLNKKSQTGTGLGLAISMQLVELHGGRMSASSVPGKGSTFTFTIRCSLPSEVARPTVTATSSSSDHTIQLANAALIPTPRPLNEPTQGSRFGQPKVFDDRSPTGSPSPTIPLTTSTTTSSTDSNHSLKTAGSSLQSKSSSMSSMISEIAIKNPAPLHLELPDRIVDSRGSLASPRSKPNSSDSVQTVTPDSRNVAGVPNSFQPSLFSILIVCALQHTEEAIHKHIELSLPKTAPHHIATRPSLQASQQLLFGEEPARFSHVVIDLPDVEEVLMLMDQLLNTPLHASTCVVVITDIVQRRAIGQSLRFDFDQLKEDKRVSLVFKPLKPSKMAVVFNPKMETALSDQTQSSAQAVAVTQKQIFDELKTRLGDRGFKILLVEDNKTSQMVLVRFLKRVAINVECVMDGAQATDKVLASAPGFFSLILCDLQMPIKDGYQTCKDIRKWERRNKYQHVPIVALSANVLGDVYAKCVEAGFNSYVTKPVDFKELRDALVTFLDPPPEERGKGPSFMKMK